MQPVINMQSGVVNPMIDEIRFTWNPLSFFLLDLQLDTSVDACSMAVFNLQYSLSYVNDTDVVLYAPLPTPVSGTYTT